MARNIFYFVCLVTLVFTGESRANLARAVEGPQTEGMTITTKWSCRRTRLGVSRWSEANAAASRSYLYGAQGHLVTVTSQAEKYFLGAKLSSYLFDNDPSNPGIGPTNSSYLWIGLFAPTLTSDFRWVQASRFLTLIGHRRSQLLWDSL